MSLNFDSLFILLLEIVFVASAALLLFRFRNRISLAPLFIFVGTNQFLGVVLAATVYLAVGQTTIVSPGSVVLFASYLFVILLVYLRTDIPTTRGLIYGIVVANTTLTLLLWFTSYQLRAFDAQLLLNVPPELFSTSPWVYIVGTAMLVIDSVLIIVLYEMLAYRARWMPLVFRIIFTLCLVLLLDAVAFAHALASGQPYFADVLRGQVSGKLAAGVVYGSILFAYLSLVDPRKRDYQPPRLDEIFSIFTHRERYHMAIQQLEVSEAASQAKSRYLTNMSHELRTPLNAIIGFSSVLLKRDDFDDDERNFLQRILENGKHLLYLINGLLDLSKIESGKTQLEMSNVNVNELIEETLQQLQNKTVNPGVEIRIETPPGASWVNTDRLRLKQVMFNLLGNAMKFTREGEITIRVTTDTATGRPLQLDIIDTGCGIDDRDLDAIFEPFYQQKAHASHSGGTGLGLAISRALCEQLNFKLGVHSTVGKGAQFSIIF
ncbi:MAG: HAMP domain-containing histidine kinase [Xanthomonadales bacterium]|nr:HAMP domain-containing histidine kinase [Xanthomonadales bacterium]